MFSSQISRRPTKKIQLGNIFIGGDSPITVQSMTCTKTYDIDSTLSQIRALEEEGCEIIRVAVPDMESAQAISVIKKNIKIPLVADIQFDYHLALESIIHGVDGLRLNPGNIGDKSKIAKVVDLAKSRGVPIRIGVNSGSVPKDLLKKYGRPTPQAIVESALRHIEILEDMGFFDIVLSLKSSNVNTTIASYELMSKKVDYPFHLGVTEAGTLFSATIKSSVGLGSLLSQGIGDTLRVSVTGNPLDEIRVGKEILKSLNLRSEGINLISCPTCGRCQIDLLKMVKEVEQGLKGWHSPLEVAVMGCAVNGPGEAREADIGIAGGNKQVAIFKKGKIVKVVDEENAVDELLRQIRELALSPPN